MLDYDLHCHSNISDGTLTPAELVNRAAGRGVKVMALTDHDDMDGLDEARATAAQHGMAFINGVEVSVSWRHRQHLRGLPVGAIQTGQDFRLNFAHIGLAHNQHRSHRLQQSYYLETQNLLG